MKNEITTSMGCDSRWLLFFYSVPSRPVSRRMSVWRKLMKSGAVPLKGGVYILPFTAEHYEFLQWLVRDVREMRGDAGMVSVERVDTMEDREIIDLFNQARQNDYRPVAKDLEEIVRKWETIRKGGQGPSRKSLAGRLAKIGKTLSDARRIDFFATSEGLALGDTLERLRADFRQWADPPAGKAGKPTVLARKSAAEYRGRVWVTRKTPFVDRMASAWLIRRFIDPDATFAFADENEMPHKTEGTITFDMFGGEFTHQGDLCTFEVLVGVFGLKGKALKRIAEIVHDLDVRDDKYQIPESPGVEWILKGIGKTARDDGDALARGMEVFEMLYAAKKA